MTAAASESGSRWAWTGARRGWLAATAYGVREDVDRVALQLVPTFAAFVDLSTDDTPVAVDITMGLLNSVELRPCDRQARKLLGPGSTVLVPPSRPHRAGEGDETDREGLSAHPFGMAPRFVIRVMSAR